MGGLFERVELSPCRDALSVSVLVECLESRCAGLADVVTLIPSLPPPLLFLTEGVPVAHAALKPK